MILNTKHLWSHQAPHKLWLTVRTSETFATMSEDVTFQFINHTAGSQSRMEEINASDPAVLPTTIIIGLALGIIAGVLVVFTFFTILLVLILVWFVKKVNKKKDKQAYLTRQPRDEEPIYSSTEDTRALGQHADGNTGIAIEMKTNAAYTLSRRDISTKGYDNMPPMHIIDQSSRSSNDYDNDPIDYYENDPKDHYDYVIVV